MIFIQPGIVQTISIPWVIVMKQTDKIRVAVLFGGRSAEHEVSLRSAANVIQNLDKSHFDVVPIGIDKLGNWFMDDDIFVKSIEKQTVPLLHDDSHTWFTPEWVGKSIEKPMRKDVTAHSSGLHFDVVFPVVHGTMCEDGTLQGLLELTGLPYVGCGVLSSAINMDKDVSKRLAEHAGINVPTFIVFKHERWELAQAGVIKQIEETISYPAFVKPANTGSSIGVNKAKSREQLIQFINEALRFDTKVIVEQALNVCELEVAVLESLDADAHPIVSVVGEIKPSHEFYSYDAKYLDDNGAELLIPASVSDDIKEAAQVAAKKLFEVLECEGMARVDLFLDKDTNQIYFNEINTIPGFTQISMYPKLMAASGVAYSDLLTHLVKLAMKRHKNKGKLVRTYS